MHITNCYYESSSCWALVPYKIDTGFLSLTWLWAKCFPWWPSCLRCMCILRAGLCSGSVGDKSQHPPIIGRLLHAVVGDRSGVEKDIMLAWIVSISSSTAFCFSFSSSDISLQGVCPLFSMAKPQLSGKLRLYAAMRSCAIPDVRHTWFVIHQNYPLHNKLINNLSDQRNYHRLQKKNQLWC